MKKITTDQHQNLYTYFTFYTNHLGEPAGFKSTSKIRVEEAREERNDLQELGRTEVSHNSG